MADRRVHLTAKKAEAAAAAIRNDPVVREHTDDNVEALADGVADTAVLHIDAETGEILTEKGESTGRTLEDLSDEIGGLDFRIRGTQEQLTFAALSVERKPIASRVVIPKCEAVVAGQFRIGDTVRVTVEATVEHVRFERVRDGKSGPVLGIERVHIAAEPVVENADAE